MSKIIYFLKGAADARDIGKFSRRLYSIEPPDQKSISVYIFFGKSTKAICLSIILHAEAIRMVTHNVCCM